MKDDITRNVFANICEDFKEVLIVGIEESKRTISLFYCLYRFYI